MFGSNFLGGGQLNVYIHIKRKVFEVDHVNGLKCFFKRCYSVLGDFITRWKLGIS